MRRSGWRRAVAVLTVLAAALGLYFRFTDLMDALCRSPDEMSEIMPGLRLHALPLLDIARWGDGVRYNFLQSMFISQHGLGDTSFYYLTSGALRLLHLPISERLLFTASGVTNIGLAIAGVWFGAVVLESAATGWTFAILVLVSPYFVFVSKSGWGRLTWTPLLLVLLFIAETRAMRTRRAAWIATFVALAGFISLTDGFIMLPIVAVLGLVLTAGDGLADRLRRLTRDRVFLAGFAIFALGVAFDVLIGVAAKRRGTDLTMIGYVLLRGGQGGLGPPSAAWAAWTRAVDWYFPLRGAWIGVTLACALAAVEGLRGRAVGALAAWWLLASYGVLRYVTGLIAVGHVPEATWLNASPLAVPSLFLVAWTITAIAEGRVALADRLPRVARGGLALALLLALAVAMARQAHAVAFASAARAGLLPEQLTHEMGSDLNMSACRATKAAAYYVRSASDANAHLPFVFHLTTLTALGHFGEFYYGLSYGGSLAPPDPNHLLDFGKDQFGTPRAPEAFYRAYGVDRFDYYVEFVDGRDRDGFVRPSVDRLVAEGARVVCTIRDGGRPIGRIYSFRNDPPVDLEYRDAEQRWDWTVGRSANRQLQPLVGTAYHFGYSWRIPDQ
ncbi:MAG: hypothetical protein HY048_19560 [Acidobacteria bacterium]|nr:hypothetical protein [Acidobacteriota bacterium]